MSELVRFSFALSPRTQAFLAVRDALYCLEQARTSGDARSWLHAACDLRASLLGEQGRKSALPEIYGLLESMRTYLLKLAEEHPSYRATIDQACSKLESHTQQLQQGIHDIHEYLTQDALVNVYFNAQKKQDWLGHKHCLPQSLHALWHHADGRTEKLHHSLQPLTRLVLNLDHMLNDFVGWEQRLAVEGSDQITPSRDKQFGLMVVGLPHETVAQGIIPDISGNRLAIRIRFQRWNPGLPAVDVHENQAYALMLVPVC